MELGAPDFQAHTGCFQSRAQSVAHCTPRAGYCCHTKQKNKAGAAPASSPFLTQSVDPGPPISLAPVSELVFPQSASSLVSPRSWAPSYEVHFDPLKRPPAFARALLRRRAAQTTFPPNTLCARPTVLSPPTTTQRALSIAPPGTVQKLASGSCRRSTISAAQVSDAARRP